MYIYIYIHIEFHICISTCNIMCGKSTNEPTIWEWFDSRPKTWVILGMVHEIGFPTLICGMIRNDIVTVYNDHPIPPNMNDKHIESQILVHHVIICYNHIPSHPVTIWIPSLQISQGPVSGASGPGDRRKAPRCCHGDQSFFFLRSWRTELTIHDVIYIYYIYIIYIICICYSCIYYF